MYQQTKSSSLENQDAAGMVDGAGDGGGITALRYERSHFPIIMVHNYEKTNIKYRPGIDRYTCTIYMNIVIQDTLSVPSWPSLLFLGDGGFSTFTAALTEELEAAAVTKQVDNSSAFLGPVLSVDPFRNRIFPKAPNKLHDF